jgi:hypothetical protein
VATAGNNQIRQDVAAAALQTLLGQLEGKLPASCTATFFPPVIDGREIALEPEIPAEQGSFRAGT